MLSSRGLQFRRRRASSGRLDFQAYFEPLPIDYKGRKEWI